MASDLLPEGNESTHSAARDERSVRTGGGPAPSADVLIVDDNPANLMAMEAALEGLGQMIVSARSGQEALRLMLTRDFAVILLDVNMPGMGGLETADLIRERKRSRFTPVIFITAAARDDGEVTAAYKKGAVDFLFKPVVADILRSKVAVFIELHRRTVEVAQQAELIRAHAIREHAVKLEDERRRWADEALKRRVEELAASDRRKDEFLAMLGHELRNPLTPIVSGLALLRERLASGPTIDPQIRRVCARIERQTSHLTRLVDDLLDISRINSGKIELRKSTVTLQEMVEHAVLTSRPLIDEAKHSLALEFPPEPVYLFVDNVRLTQVLSNLLNNAARYTPPGGQLRLRCVANLGTVEIQVMDNGNGITSELLPQVFDMFVQAHDPRSAGLGLGLSLVKTLVGLHGGQVAAFSDGPGLGSTFTVTLPTSELPVLAPSDQDSPSNKVQVRCVPLRIVIVEDNQDVRDSLKDLLEDLGHHVEVAEDGLAGVEAILTTQPDLALVDLGLPKLGGLDVARHLRQAGLKREVRLVAMTGFGQESDRRRTLAAGFDAHLVKPASLEAILNVLNFEEA